MSQDLEVEGIAAQMIAKKKRPVRKSMIAMSPRRGPLQVTARPVQESPFVEDRWGQGGGKENVPPGQHEVLDKKAKSGPRVSLKNRRGVEVDHVRRQAQQQASAEARVSKIYEPTASSTARFFEEETSQRARTKPGWNAGPRAKTNHPVAVQTMTPEPKLRTEQKPEKEYVVKKLSVPSRFVVPLVDTQPPMDMYPVLTEDLANLSMYEDSWLSHQEIAMTQLVNTLFSATITTMSPVDDGTMRVHLLERYSAPEMNMLHKRLQAALLYGALSVPAEILKGATRLGSDLGKRKAFTDFWLETYDLSCLRSALEVVVGRQCTPPLTSSSSMRRSTDSEQAVTRRALQRYIDTFLIRNEDGQPQESPVDRAPWSYQRTLLRSLMLIKFLDTPKAVPAQIWSPCLFQPSSKYKSSVSVVRSLFQMLNSSAGDPVRALNHIGYIVKHAQYALEEYSYKIENLAVDLRDGVLLTRLVELLLYPSASANLEHEHGFDATTTVLLPTGELLSLTEGERSWPLSQHLKFPCLGRATKLYNVQIALSALQAVRGMTASLQDVKAEDIVDGYREKTVKLLWGLTNKWGLGGLVDWNDVEREIKRVCRVVGSYDNDFFDMQEDEEGHIRHKTLLKSWAQAIASKRGVMVNNLTTSFADGRVFGAIVDEYEAYLTCCTVGDVRTPLCTRLRNLGCNEQFAQLFSTSQASPISTHLFDREFVLAALAFLCSRLLGPTKGVRAAVTIQKAWRSHRGRVLDSRKTKLKVVADECAQAIRSKKPVAEARSLENDLGQDLIGVDGDKAGLGCNGRRTGSPKVTEEDDIWLNV